MYSKYLLLFLLGFFNIILHFHPNCLIKQCPVTVHLCYFYFPCVDNHLHRKIKGF